MSYELGNRFSYQLGMRVDIFTLHSSIVLEIYPSKIRRRGHKVKVRILGKNRKIHAAYQIKQNSNLCLNTVLMLGNFKI